MDGKMAAEGNAEAVAGESVATACDGSKCNRGHSIVFLYLIVF